MSQFSQTLKYVESLLTKMESADIHEYCRMRGTLAETLADYAHDIIKLAKLASEMRDEHEVSAENFEVVKLPKNAGRCRAIISKYSELLDDL